MAPMRVTTNKNALFAHLQQIFMISPRLSGTRLLYAVLVQRQRPSMLRYLPFAPLAKHSKCKYFYLFSFGFIMKYSLVLHCFGSCLVSTNISAVLIFQMENGLKFSLQCSCSNWHKMKELRKKILKWTFRSRHIWCSTHTAQRAQVRSTIQYWWNNHSVFYHCCRCFVMRAASVVLAFHCKFINLEIYICLHLGAAPTAKRAQSVHLT